MKQIITLILLMSFTLVADAQLGALKRASKKMQDKLNRKIEQKIDKKVDEKVDKELDEIFESDTDTEAEPKKKRRGLGNLPGMGGPPANVDPNPTTMSFRMESIMTKPKGKNKMEEVKMNTSFAFEEWKTGMLISSDDGKNQSDVQIVYDLKSKKMTMVTEADGKPQAIVMWMPSYTLSQEDIDKYQGDLHFERTGNTKTIDGYFCEEYDFKSEDAEGTVWITKDIGVDLYKAMQVMNYSQKSKGMKQPKNQSAAIFSDGGFWIESDMTTDKGERIISKMKDVKLDNIDQKAMSLEGIEISFDMTDMSSMMKNTEN